MLTIEDGSGVAGANSLVTVEEADEYFTTRNDEQWLDYSTTEKEAALVAASYSLFRYGFRGRPTYPTQRLPFPRTGMTDNDGLVYYNDEIPDRVKYAVIELSLRSARGELQRDVEPNKRVKSYTDTVGPISESYEYFDDGETEATVSTAEMLLSTFLHNESSARHFVSVPFLVRY